MLGLVDEGFEVLGKTDDVAPVRSSPCAGTSDNNGSRIVKSKEAGSFEEIEKLSITLLGNCFRVSAKRRLVDS